MVSAFAKKGNQGLSTVLQAASKLILLEWTLFYWIVPRSCDAVVFFGAYSPQATNDASKAAQSAL